MNMMTDLMIRLINYACPAVVPSLLGPLHALVLLLPQILLGLVLVASSLTNPSAWRGATVRAWTAIRTKPLRSGTCLLLVLVLPLLFWWALAPVQTSTEGFDTQATQPKGSGALVAGLSAKAQAGENWPSFHGGANRSGITGPADADATFTPQLRWKFRDSLILERRPFACSPAVTGPRVLIGSDNYKLYCVDIKTGQLQWSFEAQYPIFSSPAVWNYVDRETGQLQAGFKITKQSLEKLKSESVPDDVLDKLQSLENQELTKEERFSDSLKRTIGDEQTVRFESLILKHAQLHGRVYIGEGLHYDANTKLYCLDIRNGKPIWDFQTNSHTESSPTVDNGKVYFGAGDDGLYCLDAITGKMQWRFPDAHVDGGPLVVGDYVYFGSGYVYNGLICVSAQDGQLVWKRDFPAPVWCAPSFSEPPFAKGGQGGLYIGIGNGNFNESDPNPFGEVRCLNPADGKDIWRFTDVKDSVLTSVAVSGNLAVFGSRDGACYALDATTGALAWRTDIGAPILSSPAIAGRYVLFGADDGLFRCLKLENGQEVWSFDTNDDVLIFMEDARIQSSPAVAPHLSVGLGMVIFGSSNGNVYCLGGDEKTKTVIAQTGHRSRLMRAADFLMVGLVKQSARFTRSYGLAIILAALIVKLLLLPLDWKQTRQGKKLKELQPEVERIKSESLDHSVYLQKTRELYSSKGIHPLSAIAAFLLQVPLFVIVFLIMQSTPVFAGKSFFWVADLSIPDRVAQIPSLPWLGSYLNLLPLVLVGSVWLYLTISLGSGRGSGLFSRILWLLLAIGIGALTYRWSSALLVFTIALLWFGIFIQQGLLVLDSSSEIK